MNRFKHLGPIRATLVALLLATSAVAEDEHAAHRAQALAKQNFLVSERSYALPPVTLVDQTGAPVPIEQLRTGAERTIVSFIFTSCAGICPMITANVARALPELDRIDEDYQVVLITVDPEFDTPERLAEYAGRFGTGDDVRFLTGRSEDVFRVLRDLDALYEGDNKMNHQPVTLISNTAPSGWHRIDGLIGADTLVQQYRAVIERERRAG
ncbi:MAG: SCO family protein [Wenzhouxiangellaceae bacterium]|nr:SCO family protein [Wenzhouxiangellaceae bacterium]